MWSFFWYVFLPSLSNEVFIGMWDLCLGLQLFSTDQHVFVCANSMLFTHYNSIIQLKPGVVKFYLVFLLFMTILAMLSCMHLHWSRKLFVSWYDEELSWNFVRDCIDSVNCFGWMATFTILVLSIHERGDIFIIWCLLFLFSTF